MASMRGRTNVSRFLRQLPEELAVKVLRGAARAAAKVVAEEAKDRSISDLVAKAVKISTKREDGRIIAKVQVKGTGAFIARWLEYGTDPHFIAIDDSQREGLSVRKANEKAKDGSLVINGQFVGATVFHPGARPFPFLRPALDMKEAEARDAAQHYINARIGRDGIRGGADVDGDDDA